MMKVTICKNIIKPQKSTRVKDKQGHYLGEHYKDGSLYLYCKRCKEFHYFGLIPKLTKEEE